MTDLKTPWAEPMPDAQFELMRSILDAPSPIGLEAAMTFGVLKPYFESIALEGWDVHTFQGNARIVCDTHPRDEDLLTVMFIGHPDKIRMQVRHISEDGKVWINSDSFLPTTVIGHEVVLFSENLDDLGEYRRLDGGTIGALGAIHFASPEVRAGTAGIKDLMLYLELQVHGDKKQEQVKALGIEPGDPIILKRPIRCGFSPDTFYGAYLDNGLGCFVTAETARLVAEAGGLKNIRCLFAIATHEEIGRYGSRVMAAEFEPDVLIGLDVSHDFDAAPGVADRRFPPIGMGAGFTLDAGSITSAYLNTLIARAATARGIPFQQDFGGSDTGTDAMAGVFAAIDSAATSVGFPIRNMHTISESGHTGDVLAANGGTGLTPGDFRRGHPRLDEVSTIKPAKLPADDGKVGVGGAIGPGDARAENNKAGPLEGAIEVVEQRAEHEVAGERTEGVDRDILVVRDAADVGIDDDAFDVRDVPDDSGGGRIDNGDPV